MIKDNIDVSFVVSPESTLYVPGYWKKKTWIIEQKNSKYPHYTQLIHRNIPTKKLANDIAYTLQCAYKEGRKDMIHDLRRFYEGYK